MFNGHRHPSHDGDARVSKRIPMPTYPQVWFPSGEVEGDDAIAGRGMYTRRYVGISYSPPGESLEPALTVGHFPVDIAGLDIPALKVTAGAFSVGDAIQIEKLSQDGNFLAGEFQGDDYFSIDGEGNTWVAGYVLADDAIAGGIEAVADGTVALDLTIGNVFTCTTSQNTSWSTTAPTNGIGGEHISFIVDNAGGHTVAWAAGFTDVDPIAADETGISVRHLQFDGTTWHQIAATLDGQIDPGSHPGVCGAVFYKTATGIVGAVAPDAGSGYMFLRSRGECLAPEWVDIVDIIIAITGAVNVIFGVFLQIPLPIIAMTTAASLAAAASENPSLLSIPVPAIVDSSVVSLAAAANENPNLSVPVPTIAVTTQVIP